MKFIIEILVYFCAQKYYVILHYTILYYIILYYIILYYIILYYIILYYIILYYIILYYIILYLLYNTHYYPSRAIIYNELAEGFSVETVATDGNR